MSWKWIVSAISVGFGLYKLSRGNWLVGIFFIAIGVLIFILM